MWLFHQDQFDQFLSLEMTTPWRFVIDSLENFLIDPCSCEKLVHHYLVGGPGVNCCYNHFQIIRDVFFDFTLCTPLLSRITEAFQNFIALKLKPKKET